jgi:hypothetical protein
MSASRSGSHDDVRHRHRLLTFAAVMVADAVVRFAHLQSNGPTACRSLDRSDELDARAHMRGKHLRAKPDIRFKGMD